MSDLTLTTPVDILMLLAPRQEVPARVLAALNRQGCSRLLLHLIEGRPRAGENKTETIVRARNAARCRGVARYVMFLDSDIELPDGGVQRLLLAVLRNPQLAAVAIRCASPARDAERLADPGHVGMAAVLFHRCILEKIRFRADYGRCECTLCCEDLRRMGYEIAYVPGLQAEHLLRTSN